MEAPESHSYPPLGGAQLRDAPSGGPESSTDIGSPRIQPVPTGRGNSNEQPVRGEPSHGATRAGFLQLLLSTRATPFLSSPGDLMSSTDLRASYRSRTSGPTERLEMTAAVLFFPWLGAYVSGLTLGGSIHVLLLVAAALLTAHFRRRKAASLFAVDPGEILGFQLGNAVRPAAYCLLVAQERARRDSTSRRSGRVARSV
jgi:hypothetical protein